MFITFEGTEGCGKSTLIQNLAQDLRESGKHVVVTREPGGITVAENIRNIILHQSMEPLTELFLYEAARAEHYKKVIEPALRDKKWVLCDRFTDSTLAYQGAARGLDTKMIIKLNEFATEGREPDITIVLDLPVEVGLARAKDPNKFEAEGIAFQNKVRKAYLALAKKNPKRFEVIPVEDVDPEGVCALAIHAIVEKAQALKAQAAKGKKK
ncbi:MAG: dTMP kinase [Bdellovibrionales bacterium]|nr:dTMP kinase [Bdellovibrionales bacterium]